MGYKFNNERPIYKQLMEAIGIDILTGHYQPGERLPSVREFAAYYQSNPNTIARALNELEEQGLIVTQRTNGKFVTDEKDHVDALRDRIAEERVRQFLDQMNQIGFSKADVIHSLEERG